MQTKRGEYFQKQTGDIYEKFSSVTWQTLTDQDKAPQQFPFDHVKGAHSV